jgi:drug/metabolite transporter (DMT)-like permease
LTSGANPRPDSVPLGVTLIISAVFMMSIQETLIKLFSGTLPLWQIFTLRGILAIPLLVICARLTAHQRTPWIPALSKWPLLRSLYMSLMFACMYASIPFVSLSTIAAGIYTAPLFVTLLSAFVIGEPVRGRGWFAIVIGFAGVLVILQPGGDAFTLWAVLPVFGGLSYALANVTTRSKCQHISATTLTLSLNLVLLLAGVVMSVALLLWQPGADLVSSHPFVFSLWSGLDETGWAAIAALGVLVVSISLTLAQAYQSAPPSIIATFDYSFLIFVAIWDYLFFATPPSLSTVIGMTMIIAAGLMASRK